PAAQPVGRGAGQRAGAVGARGPARRALPSGRGRPGAGPGLLRAWHLPAKLALTRARQRLGPRPLNVLFRRLAGPVATPGTPGAFLPGPRRMAIDGATLDLPDTPENARVFGRRGTDRGPGAFPQLRLAWLVEAGTPVRCDVALRPFFRGEAPAA